MSLHVCVVTQQLRRVRSGPGLHARNLIDHLIRDGHRVSVIAPANERPSGYSAYQFIAVAGTPLRSQARWLPLALQFRQALARLLGRDSVDLVQFTDARESLFCAASCPLIGHVNDTYAADIQPLSYYRCHYADGLQRWAYYRMVHVLERAALHRLDVVVANSHYTANVIRARYALPEARVRVCHKSISADHFAAAAKMRAAAVPHPPRVLFVGGNMQRKGLPTLISAASIVLQAIPDAEFWVVGFDPAQPKMEALCAQQRVRHAFHFLGWRTQEELPALHAQCDVFAMPSLTEAFGVAVLEAMAAGLPVVSTAVGGVTEIVCDGDNGLLVPPDAPLDLARALIRLLGDPALRNRFVDAGLATARAFSVERMMACTYAIYREVLARSASDTN